MKNRIKEKSLKIILQRYIQKIYNKKIYEQIKNKNVKQTTK